MQKKRVQAVVFDLDGTLVDTSEDVADALNKALAVEDLPPVDSETAKQFLGNGLRSAIIRATELMGKEFSSVQIDKMYAALMDYYRKNPCVKSRAYEGIIPLLENLDRQDIPLAVFSNKEHGLTKEVIQTLFPTISFVWVRGMRSDFPRKPHRAGLEYFAKKEALVVEDLIYVGDSEVDYETAVNAGCKPILVSWGFRRKEDLARLNASNLVDSVKELQEAIYDLQREGSEK